MDNYKPTGVTIDTQYGRNPHQHTPSATSTKSASKPKDVILSLKNIHKTYLLGIEGVPALRGVSLNIFKGEFIVIFGTSGGGKTSLLNIIGTIDKPTKGELTIGDTLVNPKTTDDTLAQIRLSKLGFVFQTFNLLPSMTAVENVELPMKLKESLKTVGLGHRLDSFPPLLSGGEQQRVTIARAIANSPEILLLDEPTGDLDSKSAHKVLDLLTKLNQESNMTMIMVTHDMYLKNFAHRVIWMRDGKVAKIEAIGQACRDRAMLELKRQLIEDQKAVEQPFVRIEPQIPLKNMDEEEEPIIKKDEPIQMEELHRKLEKSWRITEIRASHDYEILAFTEAYKAEQEMIEEEEKREEEEQERRFSQGQGMQRRPQSALTKISLTAKRTIQNFSNQNSPTKEGMANFRFPHSPLADITSLNSTPSRPNFEDALMTPRTPLQPAVAALKRLSPNNSQQFSSPLHQEVILSPDYVQSTRSDAQSATLEPTTQPTGSLTPRLSTQFPILVQPATPLDKTSSPIAFGDISTRHSRDPSSSSTTGPQPNNTDHSQSLQYQ